MTTLLIINAIALGAFGFMFAAFGTNVQSRIYGLIQLAIGCVNAVIATGVITLQ